MHIWSSPHDKQGFCKAMTSRASIGFRWYPQCVGQ